MPISRRKMLGIGAAATVTATAAAKAAGGAAAAAPEPRTPVTVPVPGAPQPDEEPTNPKRGGIGDEALQAAQAYSDAHGGEALLVWRGDVFIYERYSGSGARDAPLRAYSMAKTVLGLAYGSAIADGLLSLADPLSRHVEEWRNDPRGEISLIELLQMRSGLKLYSLGLREPGAYALMFGDDIVRDALATPLVRPPGSLFEYANVNCFLAGLALQRALRKAGLGPYEDYLSKTLWSPLGTNEARLEIDHVGGTPRFFAGFGARGRDWGRLGRLFLDAGYANGRQIVPKSWIGAMTAPSPNPSYGMLIWRGSPWTPLRSYGPVTPAKVPCKEPYAVDDIVFLDGAGGQRLYASASRRLVIVRSGAQSADWDDSAVPNLILRGYT